MINMLNSLGSYAMIVLALIQSSLLATGQVFLKLGLSKINAFEWSGTFWRSFLSNWQIGLSLISFSGAGLIWFYIIKKYPLSTAYPLVSLSYVFGMLAAVWVFHEDVSVNKWIGAALIIVGCYIITKP